MYNYIMKNKNITIYPATLSAKSELEKNGLTLAVTDGKILHSSTARGVRPLLDLYENQVNVSGFCACDKVVGKGASVLYALLKIKQVYAITASKMAVETLEKHGISVICENVVERILNRDKTGFCPIESAVCDEDELDKALEKIYQTLDRLKEKK
jgi:hypothetical protein